MPLDLNFHNKEAYQKWLAYGHMHGVMHGGHQPVKIAGQAHHVKHKDDAAPAHCGTDSILEHPASGSRGR